MDAYASTSHGRALSLGWWLGIATSPDKPQRARAGRPPDGEAATGPRRPPAGGRGWTLGIDPWPAFRLNFCDSSRGGSRRIWRAAGPISRMTAPATINACRWGRIGDQSLGKLFATCCGQGGQCERRGRTRRRFRRKNIPWPLGIFRWHPCGLPLREACRRCGSTARPGPQAGSADLSQASMCAAARSLGLIVLWSAVLGGHFPSQRCGGSVWHVPPGWLRPG